MKVIPTKFSHLSQLADYRDKILNHPPLKNLFLELTLRCNENCIHCGSKCSQFSSVSELSTQQYKEILDGIKRDFDVKKFMLNITGGEPLLRGDFYEIMDYANKLGYIWGMTSNATLIDDEAAQKLKACGMRTISVSIDGLSETHDRLRGKKGAYEEAMKGINALINGGFEHVQVTTVVNHQNIGELDELFDILCKTDIDSWRVINIEPIGRAKEHPELILSSEEYRYLFDYIKNKRLMGYPVCYGCSHYLGLDYERTVRDWYFICGAGVYTASITSSGDIIACLDIERRPELVQGNILKDSLKDVWEKKFGVFRRNLSDDNEKCRSCEDCRFCHGGAFHSWDFDKCEPMVCFKGTLF